VSIWLLKAWHQEDPIVHTAMDDLESFLWLLSWALVHVLKKYGSTHQGILNVEYALSSKDMRINETKEYFMESWLDVVFGNLMQDWHKTLTLARYEVKQFMSDFSMTAGSPQADRVKAFGDLELLCNKVYEQVLKSGFSHRQEISQYSQWEDVVWAMMQCSTFTLI